MNIYTYDSLANYLNDFYQDKKEKNSIFSLQVWCQKLGMTSTSALSHILNGQRSIPAKFVPRFIENIGLTDNEARYFMELYFQEKSDQQICEKSFIYKLNPLNWKKRKVVQDYSILCSPLYFAIRTIMQRDGLNEPNFENIRTLLTDDISDVAIHGILSLMKYQNEVDENRLVTTTDVLDPKVQDIHAYYLKLALKRIQTVDVSEREYNNFSINIDKEKIPEMKKKIRFFIDTLVEEYDQDIPSNSTFQLGSYLYPITKD